MKRLYLSKDGVPRECQGDEKDHIDIARNVLGDAAKAPGLTEYDIYCLMWKAGWVRVVVTPATVFGEKVVGRKQVPFEHLPKAQRIWLRDNSVFAGKTLTWNDAVFESTREGRSNASRAVQVLMAG